MLLVYARNIASDFCLLIDVQYNNFATVNGQL